MSVLSFSTILVKDDGPVHTITLNNPARKNAIGPRMVNELLWALSEAIEGSNVRAIVLTGARPPSPAAGSRPREPRALGAQVAAARPLSSFRPKKSWNSRFWPRS